MDNEEHWATYGTDLEIDHVTPEDKSFNPKAFWAYNFERTIAPELTKCQALAVGAIKTRQLVRGSPMNPMPPPSDRDLATEVLGTIISVCLIAVIASAGAGFVALISDIGFVEALLSWALVTAVVALVGELLPDPGE